MKLHWSPRSPFVRKVMVAAHELGIVDRIECVRSVAAQLTPHAELMKDNPLSKIPAMVLDDGTPLFDSRVICEYFDMTYGPKLFPSEPKARFLALRRQALGDGMLDFSVLWRGELMRGPGKSPQLIASYTVRRAACLAALEREADALHQGPFTIGHIALGCALSYLDFRFADQPWRDSHPRLTQWHATFAMRPSAKATEAVDDS